MTVGTRLCLAGACLLLAGSAGGPRTLPSDAFVWQRRWSPALDHAVSEGATLFATWHVLAADIDAAGEVNRTQPDWTVLTAQGHRAVPVIRVEGRIGPSRVAALLAAMPAVLDGVPKAARAALEIDHDAATAQLAAYAAFLRALRARLPPGTMLSVTTLPDWTRAAGFAELAHAADRLVLQVHAVADPRLGLFDPARALAAAHGLADATRTPFLLSLPAYGARVAETAAGMRVQSEAPLLDGLAGEERAVSPGVVADFLARLRADPPDTLDGLVWFRLPVAGDRRAWGEATLRAVVTGQVLDGRVAVSARPGRTPGLSDIVLANAGRTDGTLPRRIDLPPGCLAADGLGQYVIDGSGLALRGRGVGMLGAGAQMLAGWMRCAGELHAED